MHRLDYGKQVSQLIRICKFGPLTGKRFLLWGQTRCVFEEEPLFVNQVEAFLRFRRLHPLPNQFLVQHLSDSHTGSSGAKGQEGLVGQLFLGDVHGTQDPGEGNDPGTLNIIIKG